MVSRWYFFALFDRFLSFGTDLQSVKFAVAYSVPCSRFCFSFLFHLLVFITLDYTNTARRNLMYSIYSSVRI